MSNERFEVDTGDKGLMIYDHEGVDDYYFVNDKDELEQFVALVNQRETRIHYLEYKQKEFEVLAKQMNLQIGSLAYLKIIELQYPNTILHIRMDKEDTHHCVKIYVKPDYDELLLKAFLKHIPLGVEYKVIIVNEIKTTIVEEGYQLD